jgi:hypothetical protein
VKQLIFTLAAAKPPAVFALRVLGDLLETSVWRHSPGPGLRGSSQQPLYLLLLPCKLSALCIPPCLASVGSWQFSEGPLGLGEKGEKGISWWEIPKAGTIICVNGVQGS